MCPPLHASDARLASVPVCKTVVSDCVGSNPSAGTVIQCSNDKKIPICAFQLVCDQVHFRG